MHNVDLTSKVKKLKHLIFDEEGILATNAVYGYCKVAKMTNPERVNTFSGFSSRKVSVSNAKYRNLSFYVAEFNSIKVSLNFY